MEEARRENNARDALKGYQLLRRNHQRELLTVEEKCKFEAEVMRQRHERDYEACLLAAQRDINKLRAANQTQLERKARENEDLLKKTRKQRVAANEHELKAVIVGQKREYKHNKERAKRVSCILAHKEIAIRSL